MATNPNVAYMLKRLRGLLNEPEAAFVTDDVNEGIVWISEGVVAYYDAVVVAMEEAGTEKNPGHPFLRHFVSTEEDQTVIGESYYDFPEDMDYPLYLWYGKPYFPAVESTLEAFDSDRDGDMFGPSGTRALWAPAGNQYRLYVLPGDGGVPAEKVRKKLWYVQRPQPLLLPGDLLPVPQSWSSGPLYWAASLWAAKERKSAETWLQLFQATVMAAAKRK